MDFFEHGGDVYSQRVKLDFSSNLNPLGMPAQVKRALVDAVGSFDAYPDVECRALVRELARTEGVSADMLVCTSGASDLIMRTVSVLKPAVALICAPAFSEYEKALREAGADVRVHSLRACEGFELTDRVLDDLAPDVDLAFFCTPNNPTGLTIEANLLERVLDRAREANVRVVLDECFLCFTDVPSAVGLCERYRNLIVMKAFTKLYAMAGLRLGYGVSSDTAFIERIKRSGQTWAVSTPAQVAGLAALRVSHWEDDTRAYVRTARARLVTGLRTLGLHVVEGQANYVLFKCEAPLHRLLLDQGILIRSCENYRGLDATWFRVAVKREEENEELLRALREVLA